MGDAFIGTFIRKLIYPIHFQHAKFQEKTFLHYGMYGKFFENRSIIRGIWFTYYGDFYSSFWTGTFVLKQHIKPHDLLKFKDSDIRNTLSLVLRTDGKLFMRTLVDTNNLFFLQKLNNAEEKTYLKSNN